MKPEEAQYVLKNMLESDGLSANTLQLQSTWEVFKRFGRETVIENDTTVPEYFSWECVSPAKDEDGLAYACIMRAMGTFEGRGVIEEMCCFLDYHSDEDLYEFEEPELIRTSSIEEFAELVEQSKSFKILLQKQCVSFSIGSAPL